MLENFPNSVIKYSASSNCDIIAYSGPIDRRGYAEICKVFEQGSRRKNVLLVLCTLGGDPDAGFRISRAMHHNYPTGNFSVLVPDQCKSAGTLICLGANEVVMSDEGELGPLDVQVNKPDEIFASGSGLDIMRGLDNLRSGVLESFKDYLLDINAGSGVSTKLAAEVATQLAVGTFEPVFAQIDPVRLGEMEAAVSIANAYGKRLAERAKNLRPRALNRLIRDYPSHSFVIDRKEARELFIRVREPNLNELEIAKFFKQTLGRISSDSDMPPKVLDLVKEMENEFEKSTHASPERVVAKKSLKRSLAGRG